MRFVGNIPVSGLFLWAISQLVNPAMLTLPLFLFAGNLMGKSGIASKLLDFVDIWVGRIRGGLGVVSIVTCAIIGSLTGAAMTGVACIGPIMMPHMIKQGYPRGYTTALICSASILGQLIPPSIIMIVYGWITETSIAICFLSTLLPGLLVTFSFSLVNLIYARKFDLLLEEKLTWREKRKSAIVRTIKALPALMMPVFVLGGIYGGIITVTEAAAVAVLYTFPIGFWVYKGFSRKGFLETAFDSATSVGTIMIMITLSLIVGQSFTLMQLPQALAKAILSISSNKYVILLLINIILVILGMLVSDVSGVILVVPLMLPLVKALGVSTVQFGAIVGVNLAMGGITPPYAAVLYLGMKISKSGFWETVKPTIVLICVGYAPVLILTNLFPEIALFFPKLFGLM
jgi:tripartite ATP-independent transporter DctM subunit